jgi:Rrf2 family protein
VLKISDAVNLALHAMMTLATGAAGPPLSVSVMAGKLGLSENHLAKVMQRLHKVGLVNSKRGPKGGFTLGRPPGSIRLLDVYEAIEGPLEDRDCLLAEPICDGTCCLLGGLLGSINEQVREHLANTTLAHVCGAIEANRRS